MLDQSCTICGRSRSKVAQQTAPQLWHGHPTCRDSGTAAALSSSAAMSSKMVFFSRLPCEKRCSECRQVLQPQSTHICIPGTPARVALSAPTQYVLHALHGHCAATQRSERFRVLAQGFGPGCWRHLEALHHGLVQRRALAPVRRGAAVQPRVL